MSETYKTLFENTFYIESYKTFRLLIVKSKNHTQTSNVSTKLFTMFKLLSITSIHINFQVLKFILS